MSPALLRRLHRRIGLACALTVLVATGSGILHIVMTWTQSPPPRPAPTGDFAPAAITFPLSALPADLRLSAVQLRLLENEPWYQISTTDGLRYFSAADGHEDPEVETRLAFDIARRHLSSAGLPPEAFTYTRRLDSFDREYISIFRLLPVHRIDIADGKGTRLYISTQTGGVARHTDDRRQFEANVFGNLHKYAFIRSKPLRDGLLVGFTTLAFLTSLAGIVLFIATGSRQRHTSSST